jgi:hypothetical protein
MEEGMFLIVTPGFQRQVWFTMLFSSTSRKPYNSSQPANHSNRPQVIQVRAL